MTADLASEFKPLWDKLRLGYHISPRDGALYATLCDAQQGEEFRALLAKLGYELVRHVRGFFYLVGDTDEFLRQKRLSTFMVVGVVLLDALSQKGDAESLLFPPDRKPFHTDSLPVFGSDRHRSLLEQIQVKTSEDLASVLRDMARFGFVEQTENREFRMLEPFYRIFDACIEAQRLGAEGLAEMAQGGPGNPSDDDEEETT